MFNQLLSWLKIVPDSASSSTMRGVASKKRHQRKLTIHQASRQTDVLASISLDVLRNEGIGGIILDLDNTIVSEDDRYLSPGAEDWIEQARAAGFQLFILSNGKRRYRVKFWSERLGIPAISPARKPFPFSFRKGIAYMGLHPRQIVVIGDSRHTDVLGAWLVGCPSIQVMSLPHPPRWWEKLLGEVVQTSYPPGRELWTFHPPDINRM